MSIAAESSPLPHWRTRFPRAHNRAMPLVRCPDCAKEVSTAASACPHCGRPMSAAMQRPETQPVTVEGRKGVTGGVFMGVFHFFITLPIVLVVGCGMLLCVAGSESR